MRKTIPVLKCMIFACGKEEPFEGVTMKTCERCGSPMLRTDICAEPRLKAA